MLFKNLTIYLLPQHWLAQLQELEAGLASCRAHPLGEGAIYTRGFVSPFGEDSDVLALQVPGYTLLCQEVEQRKISPSALRKALKKKIEGVEKTQGKKLGAKARQLLKGEVALELATRTPADSHRTWGYLDIERGWLLIDASSSSAAEDWIKTLRQALGSLPATPPLTPMPLRNALTGWAAGDALPGGYALGHEIEMRDPLVKKNKVAATEVDIREEEIQRHIQAGRQVTKLALTFADRLSFVLSDDFHVRKLHSLDGLLQTQAEDNGELEDALDRLAADFLLEAAAVGEALGNLFEASKVLPAAPLFESPGANAGVVTVEIRAAA